MILIFIIAILLSIIGYLIFHIKHKDDELISLCLDADSLKTKIRTLNSDIKNFELQKNSLDKDISVLESKKSSLNTTINEYNNRIKELNKNLTISLNNQEEISKKAYRTYCELLDEKYEETDKEYQQAVETLKENYDKLLQEQIETIHKLSEEINDLKATRQAAIEAARREKQIQEDTKHYCLLLSDEDMSDIAKLEAIKKTLNKPRVLSMLIWQTWFQKPLKTLSANILGTKDVTGIYKITNVLTNECYIGQSTDIAKRWSEHAKCGLGIDTPAGNKLYAAMKEYGLWSFSWELLEECPRAQLNEKEAFYISMYQADSYGYNSNKGLTK